MKSVECLVGNAGVVTAERPVDDAVTGPISFRRNIATQDLRQNFYAAHQPLCRQSPLRVAEATIRLERSLQGSRRQEK
jgi:hypothetical protein